MNSQSVLGTLAEVAIAIAGFGGVIAAIASVTPRGLTEVERHTFSGLFTGSITVVVFCILPQIIAAAGLGDVHQWQIPSGLHAMYHIGMGVWRDRQLRQTGATLFSIGWGLPVVVLLIAAAQLANAIWLQGAWLYLSALLAHVVVVFGLFPRLLAEIWRPGAST